MLSELVRRLERGWLERFQRIRHHTVILLSCDGPSTVVAFAAAAAAAVVFSPISLNVLSSPRQCSAFRRGLFFVSAQLSRWFGCPISTLTLKVQS